MKVRGVILLTCALIVSVACVSTADQRNDKSIGYHEIIIPKEPEKKQEVVDFDLYNLSIVRKEGKLDGLRENGGDHCETAGDDQSFIEVSGSVTGNAEGNDQTDYVDNADTDNSSVYKSEYADNNGESESNMDFSGFDSDAGDNSEPELTYLGDWTITAYCPCEICCGEWATGCTASGVLATANHTVACGILPFGTQVMIDGQIYTVEDTGVEGEWIDIFFDTHEEALNYGMQTREVYLVG